MLLIKFQNPIKIIYRSSFSLFQSALHMLYYALVYPYHQYCITVWGSTYLTNLNSLVMLQKRVIRIIAKRILVCIPVLFLTNSKFKTEDIYSILGVYI